MNKKNFIIVISIILLFLSVSYGIFALFNKKETENLGKIHQPQNYTEIYNLIQNTGKGIYKGLYTTNEDMVSFKAAEYSNTNIQVEGVQEADIVKTDGEYIYALANQYLYIIKTNNGNLSVVSKIKTSLTENNQYSNCFEFYVSENKLIALYTTYGNYYPAMDKFAPEYYRPSGSEVTAIIYDITDKSNPSKINELSQSGNYVSSRMIDNYLYVVTNQYVYSGTLKETDAETYVPTVSNGSTKTVDLKDIYILPNPDINSYVTVTGIDVNKSSDFISVKSVLGSSSTIYANMENLFITSYASEIDGNYMRNKTNVLKFSLNEGFLELKANTKVNGYILNQFSMDETNGYFRIVTTSNDYVISNNNYISLVAQNTSKNNLYVLDGNLDLVSKIENLAEGERVYSVRFSGDVAYFVTFRNVDPLFVVDLTNPASPKILSELKIPGFSEYLHVYDENYLFGLGKEADENGRVTGVKISMFNIKDKTDVSELYKTSVGNQYSWTEASYNHKAILVSKTKNIIAFPINGDYVVYNFNEESGFTKLTQIDFDNDEYYYGNIRGLYIDNYLYALNQSQVITIELSTLKIIQNLSL